MILLTYVRALAYMLLTSHLTTQAQTIITAIISRKIIMSIAPASVNSCSSILARYMSSVSEVKAMFPEGRQVCTKHISEIKIRMPT